MLKDSSETNQRQVLTFSLSRPSTKPGPYLWGHRFGTSLNAVLEDKRPDRKGNRFVRSAGMGGSIAAAGAV